MRSDNDTDSTPKEALLLAASNIVAALVARGTDSYGDCIFGHCPVTRLTANAQAEADEALGYALAMANKRARME
jgi:hypothetical protein